MAPEVGGAKRADGIVLAAHGQLAGTPSVMFDAVAVVLSDAGARAPFNDGAAIDFVRAAFIDAAKTRQWEREKTVRALA